MQSLLHCCGSGLAGLFCRQRFLGLAEHPAADVGPVLGQCPGDLGLADPVQVADRPVELPQRVLGRAAVHLLVAACAVRPRGGAAAAAGGTATAGLGLRHGLPPAARLGARRLGRAVLRVQVFFVLGRELELRLLLVLFVLFVELVLVVELLFVVELVLVVLFVLVLFGLVDGLLILVLGLERRRCDLAHIDAHGSGAQDAVGQDRRGGTGDRRSKRCPWRRRALALRAVRRDTLDERGHLRSASRSSCGRWTPSCGCCATPSCDRWRTTTGCATTTSRCSRATSSGCRCCARSSGCRCCARSSGCARA